jgi:deoxyadenosine/deoxycytidine kinase
MVYFRGSINGPETRVKIRIRKFEGEVEREQKYHKGLYELLKACESLF